MPSSKPTTEPTTEPRNAAAWRAAGLRFHAFGFYLRRRFGRRVRRVSLDGRFTCPNVDGTVTTGGCTFCNNRSFSPSRRLPPMSITAQLDEGIRRQAERYRCQHFIAYFQPATNTYAPVDDLRRLYDEALAHTSVVGLAIGTRADCLPADVIDLLAELAQRTYLSLEIGLQTIHDRTLAWMNRGHDHAAFIDAVERCRGRGFSLSAHVILGLPGESHTDMMATADELVRLQLDAVKIHNLYAVRGTRLADQVAAGEVTLLDRDRYISLLVDFLERLPEAMVIERIAGDASPDALIGPPWCLDKQGLREAVEQEFGRRDTWQGKRREEAMR